ncbi:hypothetical protein [Sandaracinus amylolyticus]|uniref:Uncharacterized protein n=1 Tax=Sandaracinus amylolyticus TaxID=927083 RepID=A0A0F6SG58_9BACT|nr:hypothetical protein [Sandaracinus amylolyticus]AKF08119.1 hypothetical protein DB32_005268 [Sandaracinus amylolyticus]
MSAQRIALGHGSAWHDFHRVDRERPYELAVRELVGASQRARVSIEDDLLHAWSAELSAIPCVWPTREIHRGLAWTGWSVIRGDGARVAHDVFRSLARRYRDDDGPPVLDVRLGEEHWIDDDGREHSLGDHVERVARADLIAAFERLAEDCLWATRAPGYLLHLGV